MQEQLQSEDLRATKEAGLNMPPQTYMASSSMDVKVGFLSPMFSHFLNGLRTNAFSLKQIRAELEEIALAEADVVTLKQKAADLHLQLSQQYQHVHSSFCKSCGHSLHAQKHEITRYVVVPVLSLYYTFCVGDVFFPATFQGTQMRSVCRFCYLL